MSNRLDPPPEIETAAPVGAGNGGKTGYHSGGKSNLDISTVLALAAIQNQYPIIAAHFGIEVLGGVI